LAPVFDQMLLDAKELLTATVIVGADPPVHTAHRNSVNRAFTRRRIEALRGFVESEVDNCLADIDRASTYDVSLDLAQVIPLRVMERLFGLDANDSPHFKRWAYALAAQLNSDEARGSVEQIGRHFDLLREFSDYFVPLMRERKANPGTDLISDIMTDEDDILSASEAVMFILTLMSAGVETTSNLIGNVIVSLMEHPDQLELVLADPSRVPAAIEESLRFDSPFQFSFREAAEDVVLSGVRIYFDDPDRFDVTRTSQHVGFGHGIHFCLGAALARMEAQVAVARIVPYLPDFELDRDKLVDRNSLIMWGKENIPIVRREASDQQVRTAS